MPEVIPHVGGSFAPPLTAAKVAEYRELAETATPQVRGEMLKLCDMADLFHETPASKAKGTPHASGKGTVVPLHADEVKRIWDAVPWKDEITGYLAPLFDTIPASQKPLRDAAHHLLWLAGELTLDREPITNDKL